MLHKSDGIPELVKSAVKGHLLLRPQIVLAGELVRRTQHDVTDEVVEAVDVSNPLHRH